MNDKTHHAIDELNQVHAKMKAKFSAQSKVATSKKRAEKMENYLRAFKLLANHKFDEDLNNKVDFQRILEIDAMTDLVNQVEKVLGSKYLFQLGHWWNGAMEISQKTGADDVFEAQLYTLLDQAGQMALNEASEDMEIGVALIGDLPGNTVKNPDALMKKLDNVIKKMIEKTGDKELAASLKKSDIITQPTWRAGKTDVTGYSKTIDINANIKPEWQDFIATFQGANFSLKNYASNAKTQVIHLGNTNYFKAMYGILSSLGFNENKAGHIYIHTRISYLFGHTAAQGEGPTHIVHMRFAYELTGAGLRDESGKRLDEVDFFIYNDPASDNIYVRSVEEMIQNILDYLDMSQIGDPWTSGIVIAKSAF